MQQSKNEIGYRNLQKFNFNSANHIATPKNGNVSTKNGITSTRNGIASTKNGNVTLHHHF
jgi:hypothetical protein